ncbi:MAG: AAA family ATPase [Kineosporiaceae bacterium]|nr:AAA family ATPase [Aeromicrobium sp.]
MTDRNYEGLFAEEIDTLTDAEYLAYETAHADELTRIRSTYAESREEEAQDAAIAEAFGEDHDYILLEPSKSLELQEARHDLRVEERPWGYGKTDAEITAEVRRRVDELEAAHAAVEERAAAKAGQDVVEWRADRDRDRWAFLLDTEVEQEEFPETDEAIAQVAERMAELAAKFSPEVAEQIIKSEAERPARQAEERARKEAAAEVALERSVAKTIADYEWKVHERVQALEIDQEARRRVAAKNYDGLGGLLTSTELQALDLSPWLLEGWLQIGETCMLVAKRNLGKSMFAFALGFSVAMGTDFLGVTPEHGKVLFVLGEGTRGFYKRLKAWAKENGLAPEDVLERVAVYRGGNVSNDSSLADMQAAVRDLNPVLVVFDTLSKLSGATSETDPAENAEVINRFERIAPDSTRLILHHPNQETENTTAPKARGGTALTSNIDTVITLWRDKSHVVAGRPFDQWLAISTDPDHEGKQKEDVNATLHGLSLLTNSEGVYLDYYDARALSKADQWVRDYMKVGGKVTINDLLSSTGSSRSTVRKHLKESSLITELPSSSGGPNEYLRGA